MPKTKRRIFKEKSVAYKGGACEACGYNKCLHALTFHHRDASIKEYNLSKIFHILSWDEMKKELDKCHLLCSNCHYEVHAGLLEGYLKDVKGN